MATRIVLLSDGTGNAASKVWRTNVWRMFESLDLTGSDQVAIYDDGVGTSSFLPLAVLGGAFGWGLKRNVIDLYKFVCRNYESEADGISALASAAAHSRSALSSGCSSARASLATAPRQSCIRRPRQRIAASEGKTSTRSGAPKKFFRFIRDLFVLSGYNKSDNRRVAGVRFLGLWDTVAAYGLPIEEMTRGVSQWIWPLELPEGMSRSLLNIAKRSLPRLTLRGVGLTSKDAVG